MFQVIILPDIGQEDMYQYIRIVHCHPLGVFKSHHVDMIFNLGDICEWHNPAWYKKYVEIREKVYPEGLPPEIYVERIRRMITVFGEAYHRETQ